MHASGRARASFVLLLVLAAGLVVAGAGAAAGPGEMRCCPEGMSEPGGCTWLGAADCCSERPVAPAPSSATAPAPVACNALTPIAVGASPAAIPASAFFPPSAPPGLRTSVLRL